jgi:hypothetical protein
LEQIAVVLNLTDVQVIEGIEGVIVCNLNKDKILILKKIEALDEIDDLVYMMPSFKESLRTRINNEKNTAFVTESINLSKFLWDLYIIGLHEYSTDEEKFNEYEVAKLQRSRFVARKIIIEYKDDNDLIKQFDQLVLPERALDNVLQVYTNRGPEYNPEEVEELLRRINELIS